MVCDSIYQWVSRLANWRVIVLLIVANLACVAGFNWRHGKLQGLTPPDALSHYTPEQLYAFLGGIGEDGRWLYALTQITLDVIYPVVYVLLFSILLVVLYRWENLRCIVLLPLVTGVFDLLENFTTAYLAWTFDGQQRTGPANFAAVFSAGKWWGVSLCIVMILIGTVWKAVSWLLRKNGS